MRGHAEALRAEKATRLLRSRARTTLTLARGGVYRSEVGQAQGFVLAGLLESLSGGVRDKGGGGS